MKTLILTAHSITVHASAFGCIHAITMFQPGVGTQETINNLERDEVFDRVELRDAFDGGSAYGIDEHVSEKSHRFLRRFIGDQRKTHTVTLIFEVL
jgi:hypothetical protein